MAEAVKCADCRNLLDVQCNPYPVCDFCRNKDGGLKAIDPNEGRYCKKFAAMADLIKQYYKTERLTGRDGPVWGEDYSQMVITSRLEDIRKYGYTLISCHESVTGKAVKIYSGGRVEQ